MDNPANKIFRKSRLANITAVVMILWLAGIGTWIIYEAFQNGIIHFNVEVVMAVVGIFTFLAGFGLRHLFDSCNKDED